MPFVSKAQQRWMFATHPAMAKRWEDHTPNMSALPERAHKSIFVKPKKKKKS